MVEEQTWLDGTSLRLSRALSGVGFGAEVEELSIRHLGIAPQSRDTRKRVRFLVDLRILFQSVFGVEALIRSGYAFLGS